MNKAFGSAQSEDTGRAAMCGVNNLSSGVNESEADPLLQMMLSPLTTAYSRVLSVQDEGRQGHCPAHPK